MWEQFLIFFNGKCFFMEDNVVSTDMLQLYTDATGRYGYMFEIWRPLSGKEHHCKY
jgi:hypothetical protein